MQQPCPKKPFAFAAVCSSSIGVMPPSSTKPAVLNPSRQQLAPDDVVVWMWPLRDEGVQSWILLTIAAAATGVVWSIWHDAAFTCFAAAAMLLSLWRMLLPVRWQLGLSGITQRVLGFEHRIPWLAIARYELREEGVWLLADRESASTRGVFIAYGRQRDRVRAIVNYYLGTWTSSTESTQSFESQSLE